MPTDARIQSTLHGFPIGYFVVRNLATGRLLDVQGDAIEDGTPVILWPEKEMYLVETRRSAEANNQVFFVDTSGALCSRASGHAIDVEGDGLVLRHRRPISQPFPNTYSHPLPVFSHSAKTGEITVTFEDTSYAPADDKQYILTAVPRAKPRTFMDDASAFIATNIATPIASFFNDRTKSSAAAAEMVREYVDLGADELLEEDRDEAAEVDDSPDLGREVRIVRVREDPHLSEKARRRRQWELVSLRTADARTGAI
ncbi:hypothetical protein FISHEDRAFT_39125 [Fistulina hepatica ATCC 64428]|uniref:Ricin B lectin domain-containing protein n=1 Tax=Fistulina hepatica ATCC 64428 TaxID=1128425 RepID=A0A0D7AIK1_9AGAR|nr:hypothetical protein FISHEDRAFT_39125 [Fistulina hepatica ATCC 64428]